MRISDWSSDVCSSDLEQSETIARQIGAILDDSPVVETAFYDVSVGGGNAFLTLKKHRDMPSVEWERSVQPKLAAIPDARVSFQSQSGGFSGRDITFVIGGDDPVAPEKHALTIVDPMTGLKEIRSPSIEGDIPRTEFIITPTPHLAADLGHTTPA